MTRHFNYFFICVQTSLRRFGQSIIGIIHQVRLNQKTFVVMKRREENAKLLRRNIIHDSPWGASLAMRPNHLHGQKNGVHKYHNNVCETYSVIGSIQVWIFSSYEPRLGGIRNLKCTKCAPPHLPREHWLPTGPYYCDGDQQSNLRAENLPKLSLW